MLVRMRVSAGTHHRTTTHTARPKMIHRATSVRPMATSKPVIESSVLSASKASLSSHPLSYGIMKKAVQPIHVASQSPGRKLPVSHPKRNGLMADRGGGGVGGALIR